MTTLPDLQDTVDKLAECKRVLEQLMEERRKRALGSIEYLMELYNLELTMKDNKVIKWDVNIVVGIFLFKRKM